MIRKLDRFTVLVNTGHIEILERDTVSDGDREYIVGNHRRVLTPGDDVAGEDQQVQNAAKAWTPEMVRAAKSSDEQIAHSIVTDEL